MARGLKPVLFVSAAVLVGVLATKPAIWLITRHFVVHDGPWVSSADTGSSHANPYVRAVIARIGLYALSSREAIYYTAFADDQGQPLTGRCVYHLQGRALPARWWSMTLYGSDNYLVSNPQHRYSWNAGNVAFRPDGSFLLEISSRARPGNWLPSPAQGRFSLTLRLYKPSAAVLEHLDSIPLPGLVSAGCR